MSRFGMIGLLLLGWNLAVAGPRPPPMGHYVPGQALVSFREGTPPGRVAEILAELNLRKGKSLGTPLALVVNFPPERPVKEVVQMLLVFREVRAAEPNRITFLMPPPGKTNPAGKRISAPRSPPN